VTGDIAPRETETTMIRCSLFILLVGVAVCDFARAESESEAFSIEPSEVRVELPSEGPDRPTTKLKVVNKEDHDVTVRIDCFHREEDVEGAERRTLTKDVKVDVSDFILPAGSSRYITLSYWGSRKISREREFRIVIKQREESEGENSLRSLDMSFVHIVSFKVAPGN
jgi:hypothetical protein